MKERQINSITVFVYVTLLCVYTSYVLYLCCLYMLKLLQDGTWGSVKRSLTIVRDFRDVCYHSYFSIMDDVRCHGPPEGKYYEIRSVFHSLDLFWI